MIVVDLRVGQLGAQPPEQLLDRAAEHAARRAGDRVQRLARRHQAVADRARELAVEQQELDDRASARCGRARLRYISNALAERSTAAHWMSSNGVPTSSTRRQQHEVLHVEDARGLVGPLEQPAQPAEVPASPCDIVASVMPANRWLASLTAAKNSCGSLSSPPAARPSHDHQVELVQLLPHLRRDDLAHRCGRSRARRAGRRGSSWGSRVSKVRNWMTFCCVGLAVALRRTARDRRWCRPAAPTAASEPPGRSSIRFRLTSMKRATFSARSM